MNSLWLIVLPFLFLPNPGIDTRTPFGELDWSDLFMLPLVLTLFVSQKAQVNLRVHRIVKWTLILILWLIVTVISIPLRFDLDVNIKVLGVSLFKIAKFSLYAYVGFSMARSLSNMKEKANYYWALTGCLFVLSLGMLIYGVLQILGARALTSILYESGNLMSVVSAILLVFILILVLENYGTATWRWFSVMGLVLLLPGFFLSGGRGGWVAAFFAMIAYFIKRRPNARIVGLTLLGCMVLGGLFLSVPEFRREVDRTLNPNKTYLQEHGFGVGGVDEGGRLVTWKNEYRKIALYPVIGAGFFHRGPSSGLWSTGSHNFWLQMFLETGIIGGFLWLVLLFKMREQARSIFEEDPALSLAFQGSLIACFWGGMSGEYYYGGLGLLALFMVYVPLGAKKR